MVTKSVVVMVWGLLWQSGQFPRMLSLHLLKVLLSVYAWPLVAEFGIPAKYNLCLSYGTGQLSAALKVGTLKETIWHFSF